MPSIKRAATFVVLTGTTLLTVSAANGSNSCVADVLHSKSMTADISLDPLKSSGIQLRELGISLVRELTKSALPESAFPFPFVPEQTIFETTIKENGVSLNADALQAPSFMTLLIAHSIQTSAP
jgi:hypothetical protein